MKKIFVLFAAAAMSMAAMAQEQGFYGNKFFDNWYIGLNGGAGAGPTHQAIFRNINMNAGLRIGKLISPVFGLAAESNIYFGNKHGNKYPEFEGINPGSPHLSGSGPIHYYQFGIVATYNITNAIKGYFGQPRKFEVFAVPGILWGHNIECEGTVRNTFVNKLALDFCYHLDSDKKFQIYAEPSINYCIAGVESPEVDELNVQQNIVRYNINASFLQLNIGLIYKFLTSNGTHNFALVESCDQDEIDGLNDLIDQLRQEATAHENKIVELERGNDEIQQKINACEDVPQAVEVKEPDLPTIFYEVNKAVITPTQEVNVAIAAEVLKNNPTYKLLVRGYASPEGGHANNTSLGVRRANAVKDMLVNKYNIAADRITAEGCGEADDLFPVYEFNRVAVMFLEKGEN